jgi:hypothetical protein
MDSTPVEMYLLTVPYLPFKTYACKGPVFFSLPVNYSRFARVEYMTNCLVKKAEMKAKEMGANAIIGVEFKDSLIGGTE